MKNKPRLHSSSTSSFFINPSTLPQKRMQIFLSHLNRKQDTNEKKVQGMKKISKHLKELDEKKLKRNEKHKNTLIINQNKKSTYDKLNKSLNNVKEKLALRTFVNFKEFKAIPNILSKSREIAKVLSKEPIYSASRQKEIKKNHSKQCNKIKEKVDLLENIKKKRDLTPKFNKKTYNNLDLCFDPDKIQPLLYTPKSLSPRKNIEIKPENLFMPQINKNSRKIVALAKIKQEILKTKEQMMKDFIANKKDDPPNINLESPQKHSPKIIERKKGSPSFIGPIKTANINCFVKAGPRRNDKKYKLIVEHCFSLEESEETNEGLNIPLDDLKELLKNTSNVSPTDSPIIHSPILTKFLTQHQ